MRYLIDTCSISELVKKKPNQNVLKWFSEQDELSMHLSVITFGELIKGIEKLPISKRKRELNRWVTEDLNLRFRYRTLNINMEVVKKWGEILAVADLKGKSLPAVDSLIAATALVHDLSVVTRNTQDMEGTGVELINPWI